MKLHSSECRRLERSSFSGESFWCAFCGMWDFVLAEDFPILFGYIGEVVKVYADVVSAMRLQMDSTPLEN